jgi:single-stranded DNA-binding protein
VHLNSCLMIGRVSPKGPALRYAETGTPFCSFVLEVDEVTNGKTFTTYIPCEITGKFAEDTSTTIEAGDVLQISGKWKYKSVVDQKSGAKVSKPVVSSWGVAQRIPAPPTSPGDERTDPNEGRDQGDEPANAPEPKVRKRSLPKIARQPWQPEHAN